MSFSVAFFFCQTHRAARRYGYLGAEKRKHIVGCTDHITPKKNTDKRKTAHPRRSKGRRRKYYVENTINANMTQRYTKWHA